MSTFSPFPSPHPGFSPQANAPKNLTILPFPSQQQPAPPQAKPPTLPGWPGQSSPATAAFPQIWPSPIAAIPSPLPSAAAISPLPDPFRQNANPLPSAGKPPITEQLDFTDDDLREAFGPIVEEAVRNAVYANENGMDTYLEPMLRATIRRALAEYAPSTRPFHAPGALDRFIWHLQALFTSRTYEDILFEKTHRFQVEEVFLVDSASLALISFASCDPARHASARRVSSTVQRIALQLRDDSGKIRSSFELADHRFAISCEGKNVHLVAIVRGRPNELLVTDLQFALRRIEDRFREHFKEEGSALLHPLQPYLEDCLLIQAPASAA